MKNRKWWLIAALFTLFTVIILVDELEDVAEVEQKQVSHYRPLVSIVNPEPQENSGMIQTYAEIKPRWATTLRAQVSGEVVQVFERSSAGEQVKKGALLIRIEGSRYQADLFEAEQLLAEAELNLLQAKNKSSQDQKNWQRAGIGGTPSDLVLNIPQLALAEKTVNHAKSRVHAARKMLAYTEIRAPFSGVITRRSVSAGQTVFEGDELLHIIHNDQQQITVSLSRQQWNRLAKNGQQQRASIRNTESIEIARAQIKRGGGFIDPETRQYQLFLEIDETADRQTLVGDFVQVNLPSRVAHNSLMIPETALTRNSTVWYLDDDDRLRQFIAAVLFHQDDQIVIETPSREHLGKYHPSRWRIATTPLASFLAGRPVKPVMDEER